MATLGRWNDRRRRRGPHRVAVRVPLMVAAALVAAVLVGCGSAPSPTPTPPPSLAPTPTPDVHLTEPASADAVFRALGAAGLRVVPNNAVTGRPGEEPRLRINATYVNWPLVIHEYSSAAALRAHAPFRAGGRPTIGDAPFNLAGLNILVEFGPHAKNRNEPPPDPRFREAAVALIDALDPLIGPLEQMSIEPLPLPTLTPLPGSSGPVPSGNTGPTASPAGSQP
jgi:hypothetical protein